jgi:hypothetical protein
MMNAECKSAGLEDTFTFGIHHLIFIILLNTYSDNFDAADLSRNQCTSPSAFRISWAG